MILRMPGKRAIATAWAILVLLLAAVLAWNERGDILRAVPYLRRANPFALAVLCALEVLYFIVQAQAVRPLYRVYGRRVPTSSLAAILVAATMLNEVLPTSGASGTTAFVWWGDRLGFGLRDTVKVAIWFSLVSYTTLGPVIGVCFRAFFLLPPGPRGVIAGALWVALLSAAALAAVFLALVALSRTRRGKTPVGSLAAGALRPVVRLWIKVRLYISNELSKELWGVRENLAPLGASFLFLLIAYAVRIAMLQMCFAALGETLSTSQALYVYALTLLFSLVSLSPTTLGVVEVALTTTLGWFGVAVPLAVAGMLVYRAATFWLPIPLGAAAQWWLGRLAGRGYNGP